MNNLEAGITMSRCARKCGLEMGEYEELVKVIFFSKYSLVELHVKEYVAAIHVRGKCCRCEFFSLFLYNIIIVYLLFPFVLLFNFSYIKLGQTMRG